MNQQEVNKKQLAEEIETLKKQIHKAKDSRKEAEFCNTLLNLIEDPVSVVDSEMRFLFVNTKARHLLNVDCEGIIGKTVNQLFPKSEAVPMTESLKRVFDNGEVITKERQFEFSDQAIWLDTHLVPIKNATDDVESVLTISRNITKSKLAEQARLDSEVKLSSALRLAKLGHWEYDFKMDLFSFTDEFYAIYGTTAEEVGGHTMSSKRYYELFVHPDDLNFASVEGSDPTYNNRLDHRMIRSDGSVGHISVQFRIIKDNNGQIIKTYGVNQDISERKQAEEALRMSEENLKLVMDGVLVPIVFVDSDLRYKFVNKAYTDWYNISREDIEGKYIKDILAEDVFDRSLPHYQTVLNGQQVSFENRTIREDLEKFVSVRLVPHYDKDKIVGFFSSIMDITERRLAEDQIKSSLKEKETLLQEIHHRVKNNMTVISSLLGLQITSVIDKKAKEALQDSQNRVQSMAMVHETLYRSDTSSAIDLKTYLLELGRNVFQNYSIRNKVKFKVVAENIMINVKQASPVGLIVNELISNCLKYAFSNSKEGEILLELKSNNANGVELVVSDNGVGVPDGFNLKNSDSLGLKLVKMLVENQLGGSIDMESNNGTKFTIKFNIEV